MIKWTQNGLNTTLCYSKNNLNEFSLFSRQYNLDNLIYNFQDNNSLTLISTISGPHFWSVMDPPFQKLKMQKDDNSFLKYQEYFAKITFWRFFFLSQWFYSDWVSLVKIPCISQMPLWMKNVKKNVPWADPKKFFSFLEYKSSTIFELLSLESSLFWTRVAVNSCS